MTQVVAKTTLPIDQLNEWVVEVDGVRRARYIGPHATFYAARKANEWRRELKENQNDKR